MEKYTGQNSFDIDEVSSTNDFLNTILLNLHSSVFVLSRHRRIQSANRSGISLLNKDEKAIINQIFGNALDCMNTESGKLECGYTPYCENCKLLSAVREIFENNVPVVREIFDRKNLIRNGETMDKYFLYSAKSIQYHGEKMVLLVVDDITQTEKQKEILSEKNEQILSSIRYAERIQRALLPDKAEMKKYLDDYFLFYKPRDIIGGDFYWVARINHTIVISVADCTGHGIPGALITMLGISALNDIVKAQKETRPDIILNTLRDQIVDELKTSDTIFETQDGMDISICSVDTASKKISFAGANHKIIHTSDDNTIKEIKGDTLPVGPFRNYKKFVLQKFRYKPGDMLYLYSDGYKDQFGGETDKKFGKRRFRNLSGQIRKQESQAQKKKVKDTFYEWKGNNEQVDDVTFMGFRLN